MNNCNPNTQTFSPPEGGFTSEQTAEYAAFKLTDAEYGEMNKQLSS